MRVLLADDHAVVRGGVRAMLESDAEITHVGEAADESEVLTRVRDEPWDVLVLDLSFGDANGLDLLTRLLSTRPGLNVIILSMHPAEQYALRALRAGAAGYVEKNAPPADLVTAVRRAGRGQKYVSERVAELLAIDLTDGSEKDAHERLSNRELQVLVELGKGRTVSQIAESLHLSVKTVSTYRTRILEKMNLENTAQLIHYAVSHKLVE